MVKLWLRREIDCYVFESRKLSEKLIKKIKTKVMAIWDSPPRHKVEKAARTKGAHTQPKLLELTEGSMCGLSLLRLVIPKRYLCCPKNATLSPRYQVGPNKIVMMSLLNSAWPVYACLCSCPVPCVSSQGVDTHSHMLKYPQDACLHWQSSFLSFWEPTKMVHYQWNCHILACRGRPETFFCSKSIRSLQKIIQPLTWRQKIRAGPFIGATKNA